MLGVVQSEGVQEFATGGSPHAHQAGLVARREPAALAIHREIDELALGPDRRRRRLERRELEELCDRVVGDREVLPVGCECDRVDRLAQAQWLRTSGAIDRAADGEAAACVREGAALGQPGERTATGTLEGAD